MPTIGEAEWAARRLEADRARQKAMLRWLEAIARKPAAILRR